jgi:hypothetical protein
VQRHGVVVDTIEQAKCRERTYEEDRAVEMCTILRGLLNRGAYEIRLAPGRKPFDID